MKASLRAEKPLSGQGSLSRGRGHFEQRMQIGESGLSIVFNEASVVVGQSDEGAQLVNVPGLLPL